MKGANRTLLVALSALAVVAAACGQDEGGGGGGGGTTGGGGIEPSKTYTSIGEPEGELNLIGWSGYVEDGTTKGYDWVTPFEDDTGCKVNVTYGDTSDEMVQLMRQGGGTEYDGVSASGDATNRLIAAGDVGAIDTSLFPEFINVIGPLNPNGDLLVNVMIETREAVKNIDEIASVPGVGVCSGKSRMSQSAKVISVRGSPGTSVSSVLSPVATLTR